MTKKTEDKKKVVSIDTLPHDITEYIYSFVPDEYKTLCNKEYHIKRWVNYKNDKNTKITNIYDLSYLTFNYSRQHYNMTGKYLNFIMRNDYDYLFNIFLKHRSKYNYIQQWYYGNHKFRSFNDYLLYLINKHYESFKCKNILEKFDIKKSKYKHKTYRKKKNKIK